MIELSYFDLGIITFLVACLTTMVVTPLTIRYGTPDPKEEN